MASVASMPALAPFATLTPLTLAVVATWNTLVEVGHTTTLDQRWSLVKNLADG
jgi:hypothetical protein